MFDAFLPTIAAAYVDIAKRVDQLYAQSDERRPHVVATTPGDSSRHVDPHTTSISITFDRPMQAGFSIIHAPDSMTTKVPEMLSSSWDAAGTVFTFTVRLQPRTAYAFQLNTGRPRGFISRSGAVLRPTIIRFWTSAAK